MTICLTAAACMACTCPQDPRQENTMLKIQGVYEELKQLYPDAQKRSGLTLHSALPADERKPTSW